MFSKSYSGSSASMRLLIGFFLLGISLGCHPFASPIASDPVVIKIQDDTLTIPTDPRDSIFKGLNVPELVASFYKKLQGKSYWFVGDNLSGRGQSMITMIRTARRYGLLPQHYHELEISKIQQHLNENKDRVARLDVLLTDAFFSLSYDLRDGRVRKERWQYISTHTQEFPVPPDEDIVSFLELQQPQNNEYKELRQTLNKILDTLDEDSRSIVMSGVTIDSIPIHRKIRQLEINMDRWRAENIESVDAYAWINIPAFMFYLRYEDSVVWDSRIIVGNPVSPTPVFSSNIECFTIFPYWYMPRKIAVNEYLPVIKKDTSFITRNNFDVLDRTGNLVALSTIDWKKYNANNFPFTLRQREGKDNALGVIKFVFDNPYGVYLHDTNAKRLFKNTVRAYSHGCIRLEKAVEFAHYLIGNKRTNLKGSDLDRHLRLQKRVTISLLKPLPIHVRYFTAEIRNGSLILYDDIYKWDAKLINIIYNQTLSSRNSQAKFMD